MGEDGLWARAPSPARDGAYASLGERLQRSRNHRKRQLEERMRLAGLWHHQGLVFPTKPAHRSTLQTCATAPSSASKPAPVSGMIYVSTICATLLLRRRQREGGLRDARPRLHNYYPQHLLPRTPQHAGLSSRRDGSGVGNRLVSQAPSDCSKVAVKRAGKRIPALSLHARKIPSFEGVLLVGDAGFEPATPSL